MNNFTLVSCIAFAALGCAPDPASDASFASADRVTTLTLSSQSFGVAPPACSNRSRRYDFASHTLTDTECASARTITATAADSAALRSALRSIVIRTARCNGFDGTNTSVVLQYEPGATPVGYALGDVSCSGTPSSAMTFSAIDAESWAPAQTILNRLSAR